MTIERRIAARQAALAQAGLARRLPTIEHRQGVRYRVDGRPAVGFCSNDYLGFADQLANGGPAGSASSRLICGDLPPLRAAERALAELCQVDDAVLFPSGYQLNLGVLPALIEARDSVASDALNHASLIDGLRLTRAAVHVLGHGVAPRDLPLPAADASLWWVTESIFSMDGDAVEPTALAQHLARGGALYVDDAHAVGLYAGGQGLLGFHRITPTAQIGTLGKAFGVAGAFVAASATVCAWIRTRARSFVFSTGISPLVASAIVDAVDRVRGPLGDQRRDRLWSRAHRLASALGLGRATSPIFPIFVGDNLHALRIAAALLERGWHVQPIRPPTVPEGTARLRVTVSAGHEPEMIDAFVTDLRAELERAGLPLRAGSSAHALSP